MRTLVAQLTNAIKEVHKRSALQEYRRIRNNQRQSTKRRTVVVYRHSKDCCVCAVCCDCFWILIVYYAICRYHTMIRCLDSRRFFPKKQSTEHLNLLVVAFCVVSCFISNPRWTKNATTALWRRYRTSTTYVIIRLCCKTFWNADRNCHNDNRYS
jgi:hypothetical protein